MRLLVAARANPNATGGPRDDTPLSRLVGTDQPSLALVRCCLWCGSNVVVQVTTLLDARADISQTNKLGDTALHRAASKGKPIAQL